MGWDNQTTAWRFANAASGNNIILGNLAAFMLPPEIEGPLIRFVVRCHYVKTSAYKSGAWSQATLDLKTEDYNTRADYRAEARNYLLRLRKDLRLIRPPSFIELARGDVVMVDHSQSIGTLETDQHGRDAEEFEKDWTQTDVQPLFDNVCPESIRLVEDHLIPAITFDVAFVRPLQFSDLAVI